MSNPVIKYASEHPVPVAIGVFVVGLLILWITGALGGGGGSGASAGGTGIGEFYAAQAAQAQTAAALTATQIGANRDVAIAGIGSTTSIANNSTWAGAQVNENNDNNQFELNLGEQALDKQVNTFTTLNAKNQFGLNVGQFIGGSAFQQLVNSGYYASS